MKTKTNYDFDLILTREQFENNKKQYCKRLQNNKWNKVWNKYLIYIILPLIGAYLGISIYQMFTVNTVKKTDSGVVSCKGGLMKICSSTSETYASLGI